MRTRFGKKPIIVGCIATERMLRRCAKKIPADCDMLEVRLDLTGLCKGEWVKLCAAIQKQKMPVLLTLRHKREGGKWDGREAERLSLYLAGLKSVSAVDIEISAHALDMLSKAAHQRNVKVVGSFHDFKETPDMARLNELQVRSRKMGADVVKIATMVKTPQHLARLFALPACAKGPFCILGMGALGEVSRIALPCVGSCLVYGSLGKATAPGQMTCRALAKELARWGVRKA